MQAARSLVRTALVEADNSGDVAPQPRGRRLPLTHRTVVLPIDTAALACQVRWLQQHLTLDSSGCKADVVSVDCGCPWSGAGTGISVSSLAEHAANALDRVVDVAEPSDPRPASRMRATVPLRPVSSATAPPRASTNSRTVSAPVKATHASSRGGDVSAGEVHGPTCVRLGVCRWVTRCSTVCVACRCWQRRSRR